MPAIILSDFLQAKLGGEGWAASLGFGDLMREVVTRQALEEARQSWQRRAGGRQGTVMVSSFQMAEGSSHSETLFGVGEAQARGEVPIWVNFPYLPLRTFPPSILTWYLYFKTKSPSRLAHTLLHEDGTPATVPGSLRPPLPTLDAGQGCGGTSIDWRGGRVGEEEGAALGHLQPCSGQA